MPTPIALTIAGSDSSGGAGIQADLKTFSALGVYGASVITALTAQNTKGVSAIHLVPPDFILAQMQAVFSDLGVTAVKTGMLGGGQAIAAVAQGLQRWRSLPIIVDPVMAAASGDPLLDGGAEAALIEHLLPLAAILTPNLPEAARLLGSCPAADEAAMARQAKALLALGPRAVLLKGGHGAGEESADIFYDGRETVRLAAPRIATANTHGTGCTLSAAIAAYLALGHDLLDAVRRAKAYVTAAIAHADELSIGRGAGPLHHFYDTWPF